MALFFTDCCPALLNDGVGLSVFTTALIRQREDGIKTVGVCSALSQEQHVYFHSDPVMHTLELAPDPDAVFRKFKKTQIQQCIVKSERDGVTIHRGELRKDMDVFYSLQLQTPWRLGTPVQPQRFFRLLSEWLLERELGFLLLAYNGGIPIAGAVFLTWNGTVIYKYSASDPVYWRLRPNNLLLWTAIK